MAHIPVNHHLRPLYRTLAGLTGIYVLVFGIAGIVESSGSDLFERDDTAALGLHTNMAFSILSVIAGVVILAGVLIGRNLDQFINYWGGVLFMVVATAMMTLLRTDGNILNFSMATVIVSYVIGMVLFAAGLYSKVGDDDAAKQAEKYRYITH